MRTPPSFVPDDQAPELTEEMAHQLHCFTCGNDNAYELKLFEEPVESGKIQLLFQ